MNSIHDAIKNGLWPKSKTLTDFIGLARLEELGYHLFYQGKNADMYFIPGEVAKALMVRTDRCSVFDIPLDYEIKHKGHTQTLCSKIGLNFAKEMGIRTTDCKMLDDIPEEIASRSQVVELCKPLEIPLDGKNKSMEFVFRNYLTGSLYESYKNGEDPYHLSLSSKLKEWEYFVLPLFTPTTKGIKDVPINHSYVRSSFENIVNELGMLFIKFTEFAYSRGLVLVDTKFEVFINSNGDWVLGDEVFTPESSRFILSSNFRENKYIPLDKQVLRDFGKEQNWKEKAKELKPGEILCVDVPNKISDQILKNYKHIYHLLS